jgi:L-histidine Nalpha-methyltransferase
VEATYASQLSSTRLGEEVILGLTSEPKWISSKWLYDETGSELFEKITKLPEYYLTRSEDEILSDRARSIAERSRANAVLELGAGSTARIMPVLRALSMQGNLHKYVPVDIAKAALQMTAARVAEEIPLLDVDLVIADFQVPLSGHWTEGRRMVVFLGSTIGNLTVAEQGSLLSSIRTYLRYGEAFLLGVDLLKPPGELIRAYSDPSGLTARFNLNILRALNRAYDGNFTLKRFEHVAAWNSSSEQVEMRLRSRARQSVKLRALDLTVNLDQGEEIRTEISMKFRRPVIENALEAAGFKPTGWWTDHAEKFGLSLSVAASAD